MKHSVVAVVAMSLFFHFAAVTSSAQDLTRCTFYVGNSLTDQIYHGGGSAVLAASQGYTEQYSREWTPGAPLSWLWAGYVRNGTNALSTQNWDFLSLQPFDRDIHSPTEGDSVMCLNFINAAKVKNPNIQTYIYSHWMRKAQEDGTYTAQQWNDFWLQTNGNENKRFFEDLLIAVRKGAKDVKPPLIAPVGDVMYALNTKLMAGSISGFNSIWQFYSDGIHLNDAGSYIVSITYLATMYKVDPRGAPVPSKYGVIAQPLVDAIQQAAYDVVFKHPYSGASLSDLVPVSAVATNPAQLSLTVLQSSQLSPVFTPATAANKRAQWFSGNTSVAIVSQTGLVTALSAGTATITVRSIDGAKTGTCNVTVTGTLSTTTAAGVLAGWDLNESNAARTRTATAHAAGVSTEGGSLVAAVGTGLNPTSDINNGLYGYELQATTVTEAFGFQEYISFTVAPEPGKLLTITKLTLAPFSQDAPAHFVVFSNVKGLMPDQMITTFMDNAAPGEIPITGHINLPISVEFRVYFYRDPGLKGAMVGFGGRTGADVTIEGSVQTITGDAEKPSVPSGLAITPVVNNQATLSWTASTDNVAVRGYYVYKDGVKVNGLPVVTPSFIVTGLVEGSSYAFKVSAIDYAGNESAQSASFSLSGNKPPIAVLNATPKTGNPPLVVSFNTVGSSDPDAGDFILGFDWDFGDGSTKSNANAPTHTYTSVGTYTVTLRVMDNRNMYSAQVTTEIKVGASGVTVRPRLSNLTLENAKYLRLDGKSLPVKKSTSSGRSATVTVRKTDTKVVKVMNIKR